MEAEPELGDMKQSLTYSLNVMMLRCTEHSDFQPYSIPIVPDKLRKSNEDADRPKLVSLGPIHRGRMELLYMEDAKVRCMRSLFGQFEDESGALSKCGERFLRLNEKCRASYLSEIELDPVDLAKIMLVDCPFILELLISKSTDTIGQRAIPGKDEMVLSDLLVLENQVPFFMLRAVLRKLLPDRISRENSEIELVKMVLAFFGCTRQSYDNHVPCSRLFQLVHLSCTGNDVIEDRKSIGIKKANEELKRSARKLRAAGVKITTPYDNPHKWSSILVRNGTSRTIIRLLKRLLNIKTENAQDGDLEGGPLEMGPLNSHFRPFDFGIQFDKGSGILEIPALHITETTEAKWRNFIAWEQSNTSWRSITYYKNNKRAANCTFTSYALFFRGLIDSVHDIQLLKDKNIIIVHDPKKSNQDLLTLFHSITEGVDYMDSRFSVCCDELNKYSKANPLKKWTLRVRYGLQGEYLISFAVVSSVVALLLTIVQTILAILSLK